MTLAQPLPATLAAMTVHDVDVLVLGREANARLVAGTQRLWLAGTRAFSPGCVVVREPASVHVLALTDRVAPGLATDQLYPLTWNPERLLASISAIDGVSSARRVAVDGMTPATAALLRRAMPDAVLVDAADVVVDLWASPDPDRVTGVRASLDATYAGLAAVADTLAPGTRPNHLRAACAGAFAALGVTTPAFEAVVTPLDAASSTWMSHERPLAGGERVVVRVGAIRDGWESSVARTFVVHTHGAMEEAPPNQWPVAVDRCRAGARVGELRADGSIVFGLGRGVEPWPDDFALTADSVVALEVRTARVVHQDVVFVSD